MRKLLRGMRLPNHQWPEAMDHAVMLHNLLSSSSLPNNASPHLLWTVKQGSTKMLRVFGCMVQYRPPSARAGRFSQRAQWGIHLGIEKNSNAWKIFDVHSKETVAARDIIFYERLTLPTYLANLEEDRDPTGGFRGDRHFASAADEADWDEQNVDNASEEAGPLPFCSVPILMDHENPYESVNAETYFDFADTSYVTPAEVNTNEAERIGTNFIPDPETGTTAATGSRGTCPGGAGAAGPGGTAEATGVGPTRGSARASGGPGAAGSAGTGAAGATGVGATGGVGAGVCPAGGTAGAAGGTGAAGPAGVSAVGAGGAADTGAAPGGTGAVPARPRPYFVPLLEQRREPASRPASPVRTARTSRRAPRPPAVPGTHQMTLRPSTAPLRVPLPSPPKSSLPVLVEPPSDSLRAASPTVARLLSTVVTDPSFESTAVSALVAELVDFAARCRLDYAASLVAESASVCPPSVGGECALSTDVLEDRQEEFRCFAAALPHLVSTLLAPEGDPDAPDIPTPRSYAEAIEGPYSSQWQAAMDAEMASWKSTGTYVDKVPPPGANIVSVNGGGYFHTFSLTPKMTTLRVLLHVAAQRDYELHSLDFSTAFLQGSLHEEIWLRRPPGFTGSFPPSTQWSLRRPVYGLRQAPLYVDDLVFATADTAGLAHVKSKLQKRHTCTDLGELRSYLGLQITRDRAQCTITLTQSHIVQQVLQRFDFTYSLPQATPLSTRHSLSALPLDESVEPSGRYPELVGCLMYLMTCTRPDLAYPLSILARYVAPGRHRPEHMAAAKRVLRYLCSTSGMRLVLGGRRPVVLTGHADASWADDQATQWSSQGYTFSLGSGSVSWRSIRSSSVLSSSCEAEIYAGAMAAQELRWLTYLLTDLGEQPRSPPVLYVDNKAMLALCREHSLEHRTKHIALRYFLARELQQRGHLRLAYVASEANTAHIFTKALAPGDHQRFCTMLGLVPTWPHLLTS
ncbi:unnamed protein product [Closterium sp. NIES-54]